MRKQRIFGFFDSALNSPVFLFLCAILLCGAFAGGATGLKAGDGDIAVQAANVFSSIPSHAAGILVISAVWISLPLVCSFLRPYALFLSALVALRGFALALTITVAIAQDARLLESICITGIPAIFSISALLVACAIVWQSCEVPGKFTLGNLRASYVMCIALAMAGAFVRIIFAHILLR